MTVPQTPAERGSNKAVPWIAGIVVVLVAGLVAVAATRGSSGGKDDDATSKVKVGASTTVAGNDTPTTGAAPGSAPALPMYDATTDDAAVGMTIPTVTGKDFDGNDITIGPDGKAKVILFVAHWCPHCQREVPLIKEHLDSNPMPEDVELLTVSTAVKPGAENYPPQDWLEAEGWSAPVLADDEISSVGQAYGLSAFPYFVVVDKDGKVVLRATGEISTDEFDAAVKAAQTGKAD